MRIEQHGKCRWKQDSGRNLLPVQDKAEKGEPEVVLESGCRSPFFVMASPEELLGLINGPAGAIRDQHHASREVTGMTQQQISDLLHSVNELSASVRSCGDQQSPAALRLTPLTLPELTVVNFKSTAFVNSYHRTDAPPTAPPRRTPKIDVNTQVTKGDGYPIPNVSNVLAAITEFDFPIEHRPGKDNIIADTLSRALLAPTHNDPDVPVFTPPEVVAHFHATLRLDLTDQASNMSSHPVFGHA
eukprot:gene1961-biopygen1778